MQGTAIVRHVVPFGRVLREVGIEVGPGRLADAMRGLGAVDLTRQENVYFTLRQTLVSRHDELELFDRAFVAWFLRGPVAPLVRQRDLRLRRSVARDTLDAEPEDDETCSSRRSARARRLCARAPAREGLRGDDAGRVRARAAAHGRDRAHAATADLTTSLARSARRPARPAPPVP
jgi:uncharacterized protein with von Willebrand factor type A (vWA) domain